MERTVTTVRTRSRAGRSHGRLSGVAGGDVCQVCEELEVEIQGGELHRQRQPAQQPGELGQVPGWEEEGILLQRPETQGEGEGAQEPQVWMLLLQGGDGPAQQIPPHRIGEEGEAVKVDVQIEEEVGPGGVLDPADQF